jgi:hypothetical protein
MTLKKTVRVPVAADGIPIPAHSPNVDRTGELPACEGADKDQAEEQPVQAAPSAVVDDNVTVPVQSSLESTLTFELLRRQSTEEDDEGSKS